MVEFGEVGVRFVRLYGPLALLVFAFLETSMLFPFLPSEVVVPAAAALLVVDAVSFVAFVAAATVGGTVGAYVPFYAFRGPGSRGLSRARDRIAVSDAAAERGQRWFLRWGRSSVLWGRFLPGLRSVVSIPAGLAGMSAGRFGAYTCVGSVGFYAAVGAVVYYGRRRSLFAAARAAAVERPVLAATALFAVLAVVWLLWSRYGRRERR